MPDVSEYKNTKIPLFLVTIEIRRFAESGMISILVNSTFEFYPWSAGLPQ